MRQVDELIHLSVSVAAGTMAAATAAADPPELPPGTKPFSGDYALPKSWFHLRSPLQTRPYLFPNSY